MSSPPPDLPNGIVRSVSDGHIHVRAYERITHRTRPSFHDVTLPHAFSYFFLRAAVQLTTRLNQWQLS
jgi:hypothetical protein